MAVTDEQINLARGYVGVLNLEEQLANPEISKDPRNKAQIIRNLSQISTGDPLIGLRMPEADLAHTVEQAYIAPTFQRLDEIFTGDDANRNIGNIVRRYASRIDEKLQEAGDNKSKAALIAGQLLMGTLNPGYISQLKNMSDSERKDTMFKSMLERNPDLAKTNVRHYLDPGVQQIMNLELFSLGADYLMPVEDGNGNVIRYEINRDKLKSDHSLDVEDESQQMAHKEAYLRMLAES